MLESSNKRVSPIIGSKNTKHSYTRELPISNQGNQGRKIVGMERNGEERQNLYGNARPKNNFSNHRYNIYDEEEDIIFPEDFKYEYGGDESSDFERQVVEDNHIFQIDEGRFSPIINTIIEDKEERSRYKERQFRAEMERKVKNSKPQSPRWKEFINPEINRYYEQIMRNQSQRMKSKAKDNSQYSHEIEADVNDEREGQRNLKRLKSQNNYLVNKALKSQNFSVGDSNAKSTRNKSTMENELELESSRQIEDLKKRYEDKISVLEHQNNNLKDELFYLRAAILAQYEAKQEAKQSKSSSQKSLT